MCPGNPTWKWEAISHGANAFLICIPMAEDLSRIDGMQMNVPKIKAQALVSSWKQQDIVPEFVMDQCGRMLMVFLTPLGISMGFGRLVL